MDQKALRQQLRKRRQSLSQEQQRVAQGQLGQLICSLTVFQESQHIALYLANDGEISPAAIAEAAWQQGKTCYLPVIDTPHKGDMYFLPFESDTPMQNNTYGIPEPQRPDTMICKAEKLDLILLPLTGFDEKGHRMGMGGGYYDRALAFTTSQKNPQKPLLIGLAHECQKVEKLVVNIWDISLAGIATDQCFY
ncbi:5-formyltetrahydrofolate cyclo-ligase [Endozoicomonas sp.]|nr:5-formyltetrahydrofolate cyclo-ligase [Endozoicomonas sp.]